MVRGSRVDMHTLNRVTAASLAVKIAFSVQQLSKLRNRSEGKASPPQTYFLSLCPMKTQNNWFLLSLLSLLASIFLAVYGIQQNYSDVQFHTPLSGVRLQRPNPESINTKTQGKQYRLPQGKEEPPKIESRTSNLTQESGTLEQ